MQKKRKESTFRPQEVKTMSRDAVSSASKPVVVTGLSLKLSPPTGPQWLCGILVAFGLQQPLCVVPGFAMCSSIQHTRTLAAAADAKDGVPGWTPTVAPVGCVAEVTAAVAAPTSAPAVSDAVGWAVAKDAAHGQHAGRVSTGWGAGTEIRDGSFPGTVKGKKPSRGDKGCDSLHKRLRFTSGASCDGRYLKQHCGLYFK